MIIAQWETEGKNSGARGVGKSGVPLKYPTLSEAGIDKKLSMRSQKLTTIPDYEFDDKITGWRDYTATQKALVGTGEIPHTEQRTAWER